MQTCLLPSMVPDINMVMMKKSRIKLLRSFQDPLGPGCIMRLNQSWIEHVHVTLALALMVIPWKTQDVQRKSMPIRKELCMGFRHAPTINLSLNPTFPWTIWCILMASFLSTLWRWRLEDLDCTLLGVKLCFLADKPWCLYDTDLLLVSSRNSDFWKMI